MKITSRWGFSFLFTASNHWSGLIGSRTFNNPTRNSCWVWSTIFQQTHFKKCWKLYLQKRCGLVLTLKICIIITDDTQEGVSQLSLKYLQRSVFIINRAIWLLWGLILTKNDWKFSYWHQQNSICFRITPRYFPNLYNRREYRIYYHEPINQKCIIWWR